MTRPVLAPRGRARGRRGLVLKLGGELLERPEDLSRVARQIAALAAHGPLVVVHGGGKEIDAALASAGIPKVQVDGLRVTDAPTLQVVVSVLAGAINTRLVAAVRAAGGRAVGLTAADADVAGFRRAAPFVSSAGALVSLGLVGAPVGNGTPRLIDTLRVQGYIPIVACIGALKGGQLLNVNADTLAAHLAVATGAARLIIAGGTAGVLDADARTIPQLSSKTALALIKRGTANAGMVAKLQACRAALRQGVEDVVIVDGRRAAIERLGTPSRMDIHGTQVIA